MSNDANKVLEFLASMPIGHTTATKSVVREILTETDGTMMSCGRLYDIKAKHLAAGVYDLRLSLRNP